jgi:hypothetical protein
MIRVDKGDPDDAELAAVIVALLTVAATHTEATTFASWDCPEWTFGAASVRPWPRSGFVMPSWRSPVGKG